MEGAKPAPRSPTPTINAEPGSVVSIGQQGGITAGQVNVYNPPPPAPKLVWSQNGNTITLRSTGQIESPSIVLHFDQEVTAVEFNAGTGMDVIGPGQVNGPDGKPDPRTIWIYRGFPALSEDAPISVTFSSIVPAKLVGITRGPTMAQVKGNSK